ncbi:hypothetical protein AU476_30365 [Cupriavidus sp. UYMSc13B]|nr:hypothetical protein AU476_30365 [Cupriavidus sp. UYMSc13B]
MVQFPLGQVAAFSNSWAVGAVVLSGGTTSWPFLEGLRVPDEVASVNFVFTSTIWPPWFVHCTVPE